MNKDNLSLEEEINQAKGIESAVNQGWAFIEFNTDGTILNANANFVALFGYQKLEEIKGKHHQIFCEEDYANSQDYKDFWRDLRQGTIQSGEFERRTKNNASVWINASYSPVRNSNGNVIKVLKIAADITENKRLELQAKGIEAVVNQGWASIEFDINGIVLHANSNFISLFGYENLKEIKGKHHRIFCDEEYTSTKDYKDFWIGLKQGAIQSGEFERRTKNNASVWINASYSPVRDSNGNVIKVLKIATDITENKRLELQAKGIEAVVNQGWASIEFDINGIVLHANSNFISLFGYENLEEIKGKHHRIFCDEEYTSTEDYKDFWIGLKQGAIQSGEFERRAKDKRSVWINASYSPVRDSKGNVIKVLKIAADITAKRVLEEELKALRIKEIRETQNQLIKSEKMASLGNLMAGIAHEINTPLGAIKASIEGILDNNSAHKDLFKLYGILSTEEVNLFVAMVQDSIRDDKRILMSSREERKAKRKLLRQLENKGVEDAYEIAEFMSDLSLREEVIEKYSPLIEHVENLLIFRTAANVTVQYRNGGTIKIAVDKATKIIFALKTYSHFDRDDNFTEANLIEGIENVITLYSNKLKRGTELVKNYDEIPNLKCLPDQLGQVWTNLIANAIQAMDGLGTLTISVLDKPKFVSVKIADTGGGIPDDVAEHIFKPFFTTKSSGEGSGLGLDLVKKILDKHGGNIYFTSEPQNTVFSVDIPKKEIIDEMILKRYKELKEKEMEKEKEMIEKMTVFKSV